MGGPSSPWSCWRGKRCGTGSLASRWRSGKHCRLELRSQTHWMPHTPQASCIGTSSPMHDACGVCGIQCVCDLNSKRQCFPDLQRLASDPVPQRLPLQQLHGDEGPPIGLVNLVDRANVRVVQRRRSLGLPLETAESLWVVSQFVGKKLQGHVATEFEVFGFIDHTHAPTTDPAENAVMGNRLTHRLGGCGHWVVMLGLDAGGSQ